MNSPPPASGTPRADGLDPEIRRFQQRLSAAWARHPPLADVPLAEARAIAEQVRAPFALGGPVMAETTEHFVGEGRRRVRVRIHRPQADHRSRPLPALVYLHGGGWTLFSIDSHDRLMREYADAAGIAVVGVDYALAPEAPFPVALEQVVAVMRWLAGDGASIGIDGARVALGGDSAGANLALSTALVLRDGGGARPTALVLNYGAFVRAFDTDSHRRYGGPAYLLDSDEMRGFWRAYVGDRTDDPLAEPLLADLHDMPPTYLAIAECDVLHDDSIAMAQRLAAAGVETRAVTYPGTTHGFLEAMSMASVSRRAIAETAEWLHLLDAAPRR